MNTSFLKQCVAEFIGTFFLVLIGCGAAIAFQVDPTDSSGLNISLAFGVIVSVMIYTVGHLSGAHFNPAVTIAFSVVRHFPVKRVIGYICAQCFGAILSSFLLLKLYGPENIHFAVTSSQLDLSYVIGVEFILSFLLMFVIISVATDTRAVGEMAGLAIGSAVFLCALLGGPLTGASMNPARSLGPAIMESDFNFIFLYLIVPVIGAISAAITYEKIRCPNDDKSSAAGCC